MAIQHAVVFSATFMVYLLLHTHIETFKVNRNLVKYLLSPVREQMRTKIYFQELVASTNHLLLIIPHSSKLWVLQMTYRVCAATQGLLFYCQFY